MPGKLLSTKLNNIAIDARAVSHPQPGGFKTYTENIINHLPEKRDSYRYTIFFDRPVAKSPISSRPDLSIEVIHNKLPFMGVLYREHISVPYRLSKGKANLVHFPSASAAFWTPCPSIITIHDTIELMSLAKSYAGRSAKRTLMHLYYFYNQIHAVKKAAAILTVSNNSKTDIIRYFGVPGEKIFVTYEAPNEIFNRMNDQHKYDEIKVKYEVNGPYILGIGSADPRKNLKCLIKAYSHLPAELIEKFQLVIILTHNRFQDITYAQVKNLGLAHRVKFLDAVSDQDIAIIYNNASLFVFPSLYEGFGLPPLEAMACGVPVLAAHNSSIPEIVGEAAVLVDDIDGNGDCSEMAGKMSRILIDKEYQKVLSDRGIERAKMFSWHRCAEETLKVYELVLGLETSQQG